MYLKSLITLLIVNTCISQVIAQFTPNYTDNYFEQKLHWNEYFDSVRTIRISEGNNSMQGTGYSSFLQWEAYWDLFMTETGDFSTALNVVKENRLKLKREHFMSYQIPQSNVNALIVTPVNWNEIGPTNLSEIKGKYSTQWFNPHNNNIGTNGFGGSVGKIDRLYIHPLNENIIYAAAGGIENGGSGLFVSYDQGLNWTVLGTDLIPNPDIMAMGIKPLGVLPDPQTEYLFIGLSSGAVYRSSDNGANWIEAGYHGVTNYPVVNNINSNFSLPYSDDFFNITYGLVEQIGDIDFVKKSSSESNYSRLIVARNEGVYFSDNYFASLIPNLSNFTLTNEIIWNEFDFNYIKSQITNFDSQCASKEFQFTDFESFEKNGQAHYLIHFQVKEMNTSNAQLGNIRQYVISSDDFGLNWYFLGGNGSLNSPHSEPAANNKYIPGNIEVLKNEPNFVYVASTTLAGSILDSYSLKRFNLSTNLWEDLSEYNTFLNSLMITQTNGFAIDPENDANWWFYTNSVRKFNNNVLQDLSLGYAVNTHPDVRDVLILSNGVIFAGTDGGVYKSMDGGTMFNCSSNGIGAGQADKMAVSQKPPFYVASGFWHSGLQVYNTDTDDWHWGSMSDGQIGEIFFLNNEVFAKANQLYNVHLIKDFNQFASVSVGGETVGSENIHGRAYGINRNATNDILKYTNDDYQSGGSGVNTSATFPKYKAVPIIVPNEPDMLVVKVINGISDQKLYFYSGCNQVTPALTQTTVLDLNLIYDPLGQNFADFRDITFDTRKNGKYWMVLKGSPSWGTGSTNRIVEFDPVTSQYTDITFVVDDVLSSGELLFPDWYTITDIEMDRQTGVLYIGTAYGIYYLDKNNSIWRKYSTNVPFLNTSLEIIHCKGEIYAASANRGIWQTNLIRNIDTPTLEWKITQNETWNDRMNLFCTLIVEPGVILTIKDELVVYGFQKIIVKPGGRLILDGGTITTECGDYWAGIEVWGNSNLTQIATNQGTVILKNGATIEFAREAIQVWKYNDWSKTGGIVDASNSYFKNNWRSIAYYPYHSYSPVSGNEYPNKGRITNCEFTWDDNFIGVNDIAPAITMNHVNGVVIGGSDFIDNRTTIVNPHERPNGIYTIDAGYKVVGRNLGGINAPVQHDYSELNYDVCKFKNLQHGVYAMNSNSQSTITVDHCKFEDMIYGVRLSSVDNALITRNKFDFTTSHPSDIIVMHELVFNKCTGYKAEGNKFNSQIPSASIEGALVYNSGVAQNQIYRNVYSKVMTGNYSNGQNTNDMGGISTPSGLQFLCNDHIDNQKFDEYIYTFPNANGNGQGIRLRQGTVFIPAGNSFSSNLNPIQGKANIKSDDFDNILYFKGSSSSEIPSVIGGVGIQNSTEKTCPSTFTNIIVVQQKSLLSSVVKSEFIAELQGIDTLQIQKANELDILLQNGDSQYLHDLVENLSSNSLEFVRTKLIENSPYLSENLLQEIGNKTPEIYPFEWYKELLMTNIEVAQTVSFIEYLNSKNSSFSVNLVNEINKQKLKTTTELGEKMDVLTDLNSRKTVILDMLIQNELSDSVEIDWQAYSNWITLREDIICKSQMADMHLGKGEIILCNEKLNYIDVHINEYMMDEIKQEMLDYSTFKKYVLSFVNEEGIIESLDSNQIQQLQYITNNFTGKSAVQARNLLCFHAGLCEDIEVIYSTPNNSKSTQATNESTEQTYISGNQNLKIIPNPNNGEFILEVPKNCSIQNLQICDIYGKAIFFETFEDNGNNLKIKIENTISGIYTVKTNCSDGSIFVTRLLLK